MIYVYIASFVGFFASVISMAEIASMYVPLRWWLSVYAIDLTSRPALRLRVDSTIG